MPDANSTLSLNLATHIYISLTLFSTFYFARLQLRDEVINNYVKRHSKPDVGALCEGDLELLKHWRWDRNITADYGEYLTVQVGIAITHPSHSN